MTLNVNMATQCGNCYVILRVEQDSKSAQQVLRPWPVQSLLEEAEEDARLARQNERATAQQLTEARDAAQQVCISINE